MAGEMGQEDLKSRYITEDIPYGLVPVAGLAYSYGVDIPIIDATICLASAINGADYYGEGRSLGEMKSDSLRSVPKSTGSTPRLTITAPRTYGS